MDSNSIIIDDSLIYCYECGTDMKRLCSEHEIRFFLNKILDCPYSKYKSSSFKKYSLQSNNITCSCNQDGYKHVENTMPDCLTLKKSSLYEEDIGVWSLKLIEKGSIFGPFMGHIISVGDIKDDVFESSINGKAWLIHKNEEYKDDQIVDAADPFSSNWMRYVTCCFEYCNQNLIAIQYDGFIFYRACEDILANTELVVNHEIQHERDVEREKGIELQEPKIWSAKVHSTISSVDTETISAVPVMGQEIVDLSCHPEDLRSNIRLNDYNSNISVPNQQNSDNIVYPAVTVAQKALIAKDKDSPKSTVNILQTLVHKPLCIYSSIPIKEAFSKSIHNITSKRVSSFRSVSIGYFDCPEKKHSVFKTLMGVNSNSSLLTSSSATSSSNTLKCLADTILHKSSKVRIASLPQTETHKSVLSSIGSNKKEKSLKSFQPIENHSRRKEVRREGSLQTETRIVKEGSSSPRLLYKNVESSTGDTYYDTMAIDENSAHYIARILRCEPYLSVENIISCVSARFPMKPVCNRHTMVNLLQCTNIREKSNIWIPVEEDIISCVVVLFNQNPNWKFPAIQCELSRLHPQIRTTSMVVIENIIRSNFSERNANRVERPIVQFIKRLVKTKPNVTIPEINLILRENFPNSKIISNIVIDEILETISKAGNVTDTIDCQVKRIVDEIYKKWNQNSRFKF